MSVQLGPSLTERPRIPTTGMRGGLGKTLLTAFLLLAIVPLSTVTWYATQRERNDIQREVTAKLSSVAAMVEAQVRQCLENRIVDLAPLAASPNTQEHVSALITNPAEASTARDALSVELHNLLAQDSGFRGLAVLDGAGRVLISTDTGTDPPFEVLLMQQTITLVAEQAFGLQALASPAEPSSTLDPTNDMRLIAIQRITGPDAETLGLLVGWLSPCDMVQTMQAVSGLGKAGEIYLVDTKSVRVSDGQKVTSPGIEAALSGKSREGLHENYAGVPVIGVYRWIPGLGLALVAEQAQEEAFAPTDSVTAAIVGAMLVVALVTAVIAAAVTRQITHPIVQLTESALSIAEGDMEQRVPVTMFSRDEIGILAYVFNRMAAELKTLYDDLEEKVAQRTALLQEANYQIQRRAIQLATTVEVSQAATSILEPDQLLREVVRLVHDSFAYSYVGIYLLDDDGKQALLQEATGGGEKMAVVKAKPVPVENDSAVGQAVLAGKPCIIRWDAERAQEMFFSPYIRAEAALPLRMGDQTIGVLDILSTEEEDFDADGISALQNVANQITIALKNAHAYAVEREAAKRLRELDRSKRRFLANMSHELRTPLTNIIGFSRLMLKNLDGPLTKQQQNDLQIIYHNGQHLLGLINDLLDLSHIEAGLMELEFREVNLADLIHSVMFTVSALVRDKDIELRQEIAPNLPSVQADAARIRQVLLRLLANAAQFTEHGTITVRSWSANRQVLVSVSDNGTGIPPDEYELIFQRFEQGNLESDRRLNRARLGLALSKEFVEMHGGEIWVESEVGKGSTFTFSLPLRPHSEQCET
jgi:signal transduction histidine kinase/HAMP domain-containing protein